MAPVVAAAQTVAAPVVAAAQTAAAPVKALTQAGGAQLAQPGKPEGERMLKAKGERRRAGQQGGQNQTAG